MSSLLHLPTELQYQILESLPWTHLYPYRQICQKWRSIIDNIISKYPLRFYGTSAMRAACMASWSPTVSSHFYKFHFHNFFDRSHKNLYNIKIINSVPGKRIIEVKIVLKGVENYPEGEVPPYEDREKELSLNDAAFLNSKISILNPDFVDTESSKQYFQEVKAGIIGMNKFAIDLPEDNQPSKYIKFEKNFLGVYF